MYYRVNDLDVTWGEQHSPAEHFWYYTWAHYDHEFRLRQIFGRLGDSKIDQVKVPVDLTRMRLVS